MLITSFNHSWKFEFALSERASFQIVPSSQTCCINNLIRTVKGIRSPNGSSNNPKVLKTDFFEGALNFKF